MKPVDLKQLFGHRFRIVLDDAAESEPNGKRDPWHCQLPCKYGHIYPYSDKLLAFFCEGPKVRINLHRDHPEIEVAQWADDGEAVFLFRPEAFDTVGEYAKPRRRRRLSEEQRQALRKRLPASRCNPKTPHKSGGIRIATPRSQVETTQVSLKQRSWPRNPQTARLRGPDESRRAKCVKETGQRHSKARCRRRNGHVRSAHVAPGRKPSESGSNSLKHNADRAETRETVVAHKLC